MMGDLQTLSENLLKWALIASAVGLIVPASTDTLLMFSPSAHVVEVVPGTLDVTFNASVGAAATSVVSASEIEPTTAMQNVAYRNACEEAAAALRVVNRLGTQFGLPELHDYLAALRSALAATPDSPTPGQAELFAHWLRAARTRLLDDAGAFHTWLTVAELLDPEGGPHPVPSRFVRWHEPLQEPLLEEVAANFRVRRALANFAGDDANSAPSTL